MYSNDGMLHFILDNDNTDVGFSFLFYSFLFLDNEGKFPGTVPKSKFGYLVEEMNTRIISLEGCNQLPDDAYHLFSFLFYAYG